MSYKEPEVSPPSFIEVKLRALSQRRIPRVQVKWRENAALRLRAEIRVKEQFIFAPRTDYPVGGAAMVTELLGFASVYQAPGHYRYPEEDKEHRYSDQAVPQ